MTEENIYYFLRLLKATKITKRNGWIMCSCLFKNKHLYLKDDRPSFGISISNPSRYNCFACNEKGLLYEIQPKLRLYNYDYSEAYNFLLLNESFDFKLTKPDKKVSSIIPYSYYEIYPKPNISYLDIPVDMYNIFDIRFDNEYIFIPVFDKFNRLIEIKIRHKLGKILFNNSKFVYPTDKFYPNLKRTGDSSKSVGVWFGCNHQLNPNQPLFLVEGERDAILLKSKGIDNVYASMGASITEEQINFIANIDLPIILFFDNDNAGNIAKNKIIKHLGYKDIGVVQNYLGFKDPADIVKNKKLKEVLSTVTFNEKY